MVFVESGVHSEDDFDEMPGLVKERVSESEDKESLPPGCRKSCKEEAKKPEADDTQTDDKYVIKDYEDSNEMVEVALPQKE